MPKLSPASDGAQSRSALVQARARARSSGTRPSASIRACDARVGEVARDVGARRRRSRSAARRSCSTSASNAVSSTGRPLRSSGRPTKISRSSSAGGLRRRRRGVDVDAVRDHRVAAAEPAPPGPGGRLGDGDPAGELVELAPRAGERGDVVEQRLGRVGVEGRDHRGAGVGARVPAQRRPRAARGRGRRRERTRAARGASPSPRRGRPRCWRPSRWRRRPSSARARRGSRAARAGSGSPR